MIIENQDDVEVLVAAFRYALERKTYIVGLVARELERQWSNLSTGDQAFIRGKIQEALYAGEAGSECDRAYWMHILTLPNVENRLTPADSLVGKTSV